MAAAIIWPIVSFLVMGAGVVMMVIGFREGRKEKGFRFYRSELKYTGLPIAIYGFLCTLMLLEPFMGGWIMGVAVVLFIAVTVLVCLGALGGLFTQLGELFRRR